MPTGHPRYRLSAYLDGEVTPRQAASIRAHIAGCLKCRSALRQLCRVRRLMGLVPVAVPAGSLWGDILRDPKLAIGSTASRRIVGR